MADPKAIEFIKKVRSLGQTDEQIRKVLLDAGWTEKEVQENFDAVSGKAPQSVPPVQDSSAKPQEFSPKPQSSQQSRPLETNLNTHEQVQKQNLQQNTKPAFEKQFQPERQFSQQPSQQQPRPNFEKQPFQQAERRPAQQGPAQPNFQQQRVEIKRSADAEPQKPFEKPSFSPNIQSAPKTESIMQKDYFQPRARKKGGFFAAIVIISLIFVIFLGAAGVLVVTNTFDLNAILAWDFFGKSPEAVIDTMFEKMSAASYSTKLNMSFSAPEGTASIAIDSQNGTTDKNNPKANITFDLLAESSMSGVPQNTAIANINLITANKNFYAKINNLFVPNAPEIFSDLSGIQGRWLKIDEESARFLSEAENISLPASEQINKAGNLQFLRPFLVFDKKLPDEKINNVDAYHYILKVDKDNVKKFISDSMAAQENAMAASFASEIINGILEQMGDLNFDVWIGKKDNMLYSLRFEKIFAIGIPEKEVSVYIKADNSNFNTPVIIEEPIDSQKIEFVILPILQKEKIRKSLWQIASVAGDTYDANKSYSKLCNRGLLNGYLENHGNSLLAFNSDIISSGGGKPACFAGVQNFCVSTQLPDGTYMCAGKNGTGVTKCINTYTVCK